MENVETAVGLINKTTVLYMHFLGHFFTFPLRSLREISLCDVFRWTKKSRRQILFFFFLNLSAVPTFGILSVLERTRQRWKKMEIFSAITVFDAKAPFCQDPTQVIYMCCRTNKIRVKEYNKNRRKARSMVTATLKLIFKLRINL